ncbi:pYEATS domain-containing protein [Sinorhizobium meliloti]|uniref:pYEATS domain-containing protein n=1 Tax=Rhizobium meliloti TaxID=382 RepID=UPI003999CA3D
MTINLTLEAHRSAKIGVGDFAWFVLHPTFSPSTRRVSFRGNGARLHIQAWDEFTSVSGSPSRTPSLHVTSPVFRVRHKNALIKIDFTINSGGSKEGDRPILAGLLAAC